MMQPSSPFRRAVVAGTVGLAFAAAAALAHDMFLKPSQYFVAPNAAIPTVLLNGTFDKSSNSIDRTRLLDISLVGPAGRTRIDTTAWDPTGDTSRVTLKAGAAGTYVLGVSTKPNAIELDARDFNLYLKEDGLPDELARREKSGEINTDAHECYAKHVKAIVQVGDTRTDGHSTALAYPAEIVPLENPYAVAKGGTLRVRVLVDGQPVVNQLVVFGARTPTGDKVAERSTRSGADGVASIAVTGPGVWYLKFISMRKLTGQPDGITHESKWATLTFGVK